MKIPEAKGAVDKEWEKLEKIPAWNLTKVRSKSEVIGEARTKGAKVHFALLMDICHLKNAELETKQQKYKGRVVLEVILWKTILDLMQYSLNKVHQHHKWQPPKSWISSPDCQVAMDKQQTQYRLIPKWKWKMLTIIENSKIGVSRHLDSSTTTQMAKIMVQYGRPSRSIWKEFARSSFGRTVMGKAIWENPIEVRLWKGFQ